MKMTEEKSDRIQVLRGLSTIAVVLIHNTPIGLMQVWCRPFVNFSVGCFLFLSGLLSTADRWKPKKRIIKVVIPYLIWTLIYVVIHHYKAPTQIPVIYIKQLATANAAAALYYVFVYCEFTLLIPLVDRLAKSKFHYWGFAISPIEIVVMRLIPLLTGYEINKYIQLIMHVSCLGWFTYFYLGYLLGNDLIKIKGTSAQLLGMWVLSIILQILEGYGYYSITENICGTQLKLSAILSGVLFVLLAYKYVTSDHKTTYKYKILYLLGDCSFGIFFSHLAVMAVLNKIPFYKTAIVYPLNAIVAIAISCGLALLGRKILGKYSKWFAF